MTQKQTKQKGFTIVELLIVVVIIAILAAITIVAYNGIQARANTSAAQSAANTVMKKLEAYNAINTGYPTATTVTTALNGDETTKLTGTGITLGTPTAANGKTTIQVTLCGATGSGAVISYWDYTAATPAITTLTSTGNKSIAVGAGIATCTTATT